MSLEQLVYYAAHGDHIRVRELIDDAAVIDLDVVINALLAAVTRGYPEVVRVLISIPGIDISFGCNTPLYQAARYNRLEVVRVLLEGIRARCPNAFCPDRSYHLCGVDRAALVAFNTNHLDIAQTIDQWLAEYDRI